MTATISTFGLSRELIAFADHDQVLSTAIPEIPALEAYVDATVESNGAAVEALVEKIKQQAKRFADAFVAHIVNYKSWYTKAIYVLTAVGAVLAGIITADGVVITAAVLVNPAVIIPAIAIGVLVIAIQSARSIPLAIKESLELRLPTTVQERSSYVNRVRRIFKDRANLNIDKLKLATLSAEEKGKTARELGYTKEHIEEVVRDVTEAIDAIKRCDFIAERLKALSESVEATTSNGRAALVFITTLITKTMHLAVTNTIKGAHQVEKIDTAVKHVEHEKSLHSNNA